MSDLSLAGFNAQLMGSLVFARKEAGLTQLAIAKELGCSRPEIANKETMRSAITAEQIDLWCRACSARIEDIWPTRGQTP